MSILIVDLTLMPLDFLISYSLVSKFEILFGQKIQKEAIVSQHSAHLLSMQLFLEKSQELSTS